MVVNYCGRVQLYLTAFENSECMFFSKLVLNFLRDCERFFHPKCPLCQPYTYLYGVVLHCLGLQAQGIQDEIILS